MTETMEQKTLGFHGDTHLLRLVDAMIPHCSAFIETGSFLGHTAKYVAKRFHDIIVLTCESDSVVFRNANANLVGIPNAAVFYDEAPLFLGKLFDESNWILNSCCLYWLDAHCGGTIRDQDTGEVSYRWSGTTGWPLFDEIRLVTERCDSGLVMIDDFEVPGRPEFGFDTYCDVACGLEAIRSSLAAGKEYRLILPKYTEHTSPKDPLRGVGVIVFGVDFELPDDLKDSFTMEEI